MANWLQNEVAATHTTFNWTKLLRNHPKIELLQKEKYQFQANTNCFQISIRTLCGSRICRPVVQLAAFSTALTGNTVVNVGISTQIIKLLSVAYCNSFWALVFPNDIHRGCTVCPVCLVRARNRKCLILITLCKSTNVLLSLSNKDFTRWLNATCTTLSPLLTNLYIEHILK